MMTPEKLKHRRRSLIIAKEDPSKLSVVTTHDMSVLEVDKSGNKNSNN